MKPIIQIYKQIKKRFQSNLFLLGFIIIFFIVELTIFNKITALYYVDVYNYIYQANEIVQTGNFFSYTSRGFPFVWLLGFIINISSPFTNDLIFISKLTMFFISLFFYSVIYLAIKKITNQICAFFSAIFLLFDPIYIEYFLIAYLEPFSLLMGWLALYLLFNFFDTNKKLYFILSIIVSIISGFTRFEMFLIFTLPILIISLCRGIILKEERRFTLILLIGLIPFLILLFPIFLNYYSTVTRFDIITRIFMGLGNKDVVSNVFLELSSITDVTFFNMLFITICFIGLIIFIYKSVKDCYYQQFPKAFSSILYTLITVVAIIGTISFYGYIYTIINSEIDIIPKISSRSLLLSKSFLIPLFIYGIHKFIYGINKLFSTFNRNLLKNYQKISNMVFKILTHVYFVKKLQYIKRIVDISTRRISGFKDKDLKLKFISFGITSCLIFPVCFTFVPQLWVKGIQRVKYNSVIMETFEEAGQWLENVLEPDDIVFLPEIYVFYVNNPTLKENGLSYNNIWVNSGIILKADTTPEELKIVRNELINTIKLNSKVKYLVVDWMDPIRSVFNLNVDDELYDLIHLTHKLTVKSGSYRPSILIYKSQIFPAIYNFKDDDVGTTGTTISWVDTDWSDANSYGVIISEFQGHKKVLDCYAPATENYRLIHKLYPPAQFTIEFWIATDDVSVYQTFILHKTISLVSTNLAYVIEFNSGDLRALKGNSAGGHSAVMLVSSASNNTWYHIKAVIDTDTDTFEIFCDGDSKGTYNFYDDQTFTTGELNYITLMYGEDSHTYYDAFAEF